MKAFSTLALFAILASSVIAEFDTESHTTITIFKFTTVTASSIFSTVPPSSTVTTPEKTIFSTVYVDQFGNSLNTATILFDTVAAAPVTSVNPTPPLTKSELVGVNSTIGKVNSSISELNSALAGLNSTLAGFNSTLNGFNSTLNRSNSTLVGINATLTSTNATFVSVNSSLASGFVPSMNISANQTATSVSSHNVSVSIAGYVSSSSVDSYTSPTVTDDSAAALKNSNLISVSWEFITPTLQPPNLISVSWEFITPTLKAPSSFATLYDRPVFEPSASNVVLVTTIINETPAPTISASQASSFSAIVSDLPASSFSTTTIESVAQPSSFLVIASAFQPSSISRSDSVAQVLSSAGPPPQPSENAPDDFAAMCLEEHNKFRAMHDAPPVVWNTSLANYAATWMNQIDCELYHSPAPFGENLSINWPSPKESIGHWYNEKALYAYDNPVFSHSTGHFTQMVWKSTTSIGCATRNCPNGDFLVCEYYPPGNADGKFTENVIPY